MKHVLNCNGDEIMVSQQFPTTGSNRTFPSLKAVKIKVVSSLGIVLGK